MHGPEGDHVYRFDFALTNKDAAQATSTTSFTLNLEEGHPGEVMIGKNVPLGSAAPTGGPIAGPRQDVGLKVHGNFHARGDDVLLDVNVEVSSFEPGSVIRKVVTVDSALAPVGKSTLVAALDEDKRHYELTVTPTKLR